MILRTQNHILFHTRTHTHTQTHTYIETQTQIRTHNELLARAEFIHPDDLEVTLGCYVSWYVNYGTLPMLVHDPSIVSDPNGK